MLKPEPTPEDIGRWVYYIPKHLRKQNDTVFLGLCKKGQNHKHCEHGVITSFNDMFVHVLFQGKVHSQGTLREDLEWE